MAGRAAALRDSDHGDLRAHLVAAAQRLVARRGTGGVTVREIAAEAGVAVGVLYNHFQDKDELLALGLHAHCRAAEAALGPPPGVPGSAPLPLLLRGYVQRAVDFHLAVLPAFAGVMAEPGLAARFAALPNPTADGLGLREELARFLRGEQTLGRLARDADVEVAATMVIGACHELLLPHLYGAPHRPPPDDFAAKVTTTLLRGTGSETGPGSETGTGCETGPEAKREPEPRPR